MENKMLNEYKRILEDRGQKPSDCVVLHFRFRGNQNSFHFEIMEKKLSGYIYDSYEDGNVFVVLSRNDAKIEKLKVLAKLMNGEYIDNSELPNGHTFR